MDAIGSWPVFCALSGHHGGVAGALSLVWPQWGRGRSPWPRMAAVGACPVLLAPYRLSLGPRMAAVGAWLVFWTQNDRRGGVVGPLIPVWLRGGMAG